MHLETYVSESEKLRMLTFFQLSGMPWLLRGSKAMAFPPPSEGGGMAAYHLPESLYVAMSVEAAARLCGRGVLSVALVTATAAAAAVARHSSDEICSWTVQKAPATAPSASACEGSSGANVIQKIRIATPVLRLYYIKPLLRLY